MINKISTFGIALVAFVGMSGIANAEICVPEEANQAEEHAAVNDQAPSPAQMRFEFHLASMSADTGSRIHTDGLNFSRPVRVVSAEEFQIDWRR